MKYKVFAKPSVWPLALIVGLDSDDTPADYEVAGAFEHAASTAGFVDNAVAHVLFQHARDIAYRKYGEQDMQRTTINYTASIMPVKFWQVPTSLIHINLGANVTIGLETEDPAAKVELTWKLLDGQGDSLKLEPQAGTKTCKVTAQAVDRTTVEVQDVFSKATWKFQFRVVDPDRHNYRENVPMSAAKANEPE